MKITTPKDVHNIETWEEASKYVSQTQNAIVNVLNGNVDLLDNAATSLVSVSFDAAAQERGVNHTLQRIPRGYFVVGRSAAMDVFDGATPNTDKVLYVRAGAAGTAMLLLF